jgi:hypothetical protein
MERIKKPALNTRNEHKNDSERRKFFKSVICYKCKEKRHTANSCKIKTATKKIAAIQKDDNDSDKLHHTDNNYSTFDDPNEDDLGNSSAEINYYEDPEQYSSNTDLKINSLLSTDCATLVVYVRFFNTTKTITALVDTGSDFNIIRKDLYDELKLH